MPKIKFSIIMPCYNSEKWVKDALDSIVGQTYPEWELIAVNDGSTDNTLNILNDYSNLDGRIKVVSKSNGGYVSAVNMGLDYVDGDYFLFLGSDDRLGTKLFEVLCQQIDNVAFLPDLIAFRTRKVIDGEVKGVDSWTSFETVASAQNSSINNYIKSFSKHAAIFSCRDTSKCFKTSLLNGLRYYGKYGIDADGIFSMLLGHRATSFLSVPYDGYYWTLRSDSVSASYSLEKNIDRINNWRMFYDEILKLDKSEITCYERDLFSGDLLIACYVAKNLKNAIKYHSFLRSNAKHAKRILLSIAPDKIGGSLKLTSVSPVLYCVVNGIRSLFGKK